MYIYLYNITYKFIMTFGILGKKVAMTQIFDIKGSAIAVTLISCGPCCISQIKTKDNAGYNAIQLAYFEISSSKNKISKPEVNHFTKKNLAIYRYLKEFKIKNVLDYNISQIISLNSFKVGEHLNIKGFTIGKGNGSNIKRNHFSRGPMSHGSKHHRLQGSLGAGTSPGRVFPGKKMPGRLGMTYCTIKNLEILFIDAKKNLLVIKGSVPGKIGSLLKVSTNNKNLC